MRITSRICILHSSYFFLSFRPALQKNEWYWCNKHHTYYYYVGLRSDVKISERKHKFSNCFFFSPFSIHLGTYVYCSYKWEDHLQTNKNYVCQKDINSSQRSSPPPPVINFFGMRKSSVVTLQIFGAFLHILSSVMHKIDNLSLVCIVAENT